MRWAPPIERETSTALNIPPTGKVIVLRECFGMTEAPAVPTYGVGWRKIGGHVKKHWKTHALVASIAVPGLGWSGAVHRGYKVYKGAKSLAQVGRPLSA